MVKRITPRTRLTGLVNEYPFLLEFLADYKPEFGKLRNRVMRHTVGRVATLEMVAVMGEVPVEKLIADIREAVKNETGVELPFEADGKLDDEERGEALKDIIKDLHAGGDISELKIRFAELIEEVGPTEIAEMEQALIKEGFPEEEIKRLCDLHVEIFKEGLKQQETPDTKPGHPVHTFRAENEVLGRYADELLTVVSTLGDPPDKKIFERKAAEINYLLGKLSEIEKHYVRKENQLFPFLEKNGLTGPPKVMWAIHDDVRALLKEAGTAVGERGVKVFAEKASKLASTVKDMIFKEERILFPMSLEILDETEWTEIKAGEPEIGYAFVTPGNEWRPTEEPKGEKQTAKAALTDALIMETGLLSLEQVNLMLKNLPADITFVDENDTVRYYSDAPDRVFPRSPGIIGRKVQDCHPPKSVHIVQEILERFRSGDKDVAEFWINLQGKFLHIRYFALRDRDGIYRGTLEVTQDVTEIRKLESARRLLDWEKEDLDN